MPKILLPTSDAPPKRGGVARYIASLVSVRPEVVLDILPEYRSMVWTFCHLVKNAWSFRELWTHHVVPVGTACWLFSLMSRMPYVVFLHGLDFDLVRLHVWKKFLARIILRRARRVVTNSVALQREVAAFTGRADIFVLYPCVSPFFVQASEKIRKDLHYYTPAQLTRMLAATLAGASGVGVSFRSSMDSHMTTTPVRLLTVARLVERKGHRKVLEAMKEIPSVLYTVVGDGPLRASLEATAQEWGVSDRVTFLSHVPDEELPEIYASHDIFVMPTTKSECDREGFGIVYAEAGLFCLPCIATDVPGVDEVIERDVTGLLVADTSEALREGIEKLVASSGMRSRMGSAARARVLERFSEKIFFEKSKEI